MKKIILFLIVIFLLSGCYVLPDELGFIDTVKTLNTPEKICNYMQDNFTYKENFYSDPDAYILWLSGEGDCDDMSIFAATCATYHSIPVYQIHLYFKGVCICHSLAVYLENGKYTYSSNQTYYPLYASNFNDIVLDYFERDRREINFYEIYDYDMNLIN
ncbi:MAG: membrane lipoprotein lipid attachment site-containing protein [Bacteroidetes bacterium]|nr:membrane lipoprotein lipid attachment site-containing protein [Bacteroidota bacterium]